MFEHYPDSTCTLFTIDENQPFSSDVKFKETEITSWLDKEFWETKPVVVDLRGTLICWRDSIEFQFPRFRKKLTGLSTYNTSLTVRKTQRKVILSPGYPFYYDAFQVFLWTVDSENYIKILFLDISLKSFSNKSQCNYNQSSYDVILLSKKPLAFSLDKIPEYIGFYFGFERNGQSPVIRTDSTILYLYFWTYGNTEDLTARGFRALVYSEDTPECGLPDEDKIYRCSMYYVRFASQEIWQTPDRAYETHFIYSPKDVGGIFSYIRVVFERFEVSCFKDSQFILYGHLETWNICNLNKPRGPMILYNKMEIKYRTATTIDPRHPIEHFRSLVKHIKREDSPNRPPPFFFEEITKVCHENNVGPSHGACLQTGAYRTIKELCVDQFSKCYTLYNLMQDVKTNTWTWAASYCEKKDGFLLTLQSPEEINYIRRALLEFSMRFVWVSKSYQDRSTHIGLFRFTNSEGIVEERWTDGSPLTITAWSRDDQTMMDAKRDCTIMDFTNISNENPWHRTSCDDVVEFLVCEKKIAKRATVIDVTRVRDFVKTDMQDIAHILYRCAVDEWIHILSVCNGVTECSNGIDELDCNEAKVCGGVHFQCTDGECIHISRVCDFRQDCADNSDEFCDFQINSSGQEFTCANSQSIPQYQICDAVPHCLDGSDEQNCETCNSSVAFQCGDKRCIPLHLTCDMYADCEFAEDEVSCEEWKYNTCDDVFLGGIRDSGVFLIGDVWAECIFDFYNKTVIMNFHNIDWKQVARHDDWIQIIPEAAVKEAFRSGYTCYQKLTLDLPVYRKEMESVLNHFNNSNAIQEFVIPITIRSEDEISPGLHVLIEGDVGHTNIIFGKNYNEHKRSIYTGLVSCYKEFISAEVSVENHWMYLTPCGLNLRPVYIKTPCVFDTDGARPVDGCRSLEHLKNCEQYQCSVGYFKCPRSFCVPYSLVCDGRIHCLDGTDEMNCSSSPGIQSIYIYFFGVDNDLAHAAHNLAAQLYKEDLRIQIINIVKSIIINTKDGLSTGYIFRTYHLTSIMSYINRNQKELNISLDNFETDMNKVVQKFNANETLTLFLQNKKLKKDEEYIIDKIDKTLSSQFKYRVEKKENLHKKLQMTMPGNKLLRYVAIDTWKVLRTGGSLLFPDIYTADSPCRNAFRCGFSHVCIPLSQVCDKKPQCPHGEDEEVCDFVCPKYCACKGYSASCPKQSHNVFNFLSSSIRTLDVNHCTGLNGTLDIQSNFFFLIELNISFSNITFVSHESFSHTKHLLTLDLSHNLLTVIRNDVFDGLRHLKLLLLCGNGLISVIEPSAFSGLGVKDLTISYTKLKSISKESFKELNLSKLDLSHGSIETVEDFAFQGLIVSELDIGFNPISYFGKAMFKGLIGVQKLKTPMYKFCCIRPIYLEEKNCFPHRDEFSSCGDLMRRTSLQVLLWIIGILAIAGNIVSIVFRVFFDKKRLKMVYGIFVTNLALADLLMGFYMLIIAIADSVYRGRYIEEDEFWRRSVWCRLAGVLSTVSSEASVLFACLITVDRLIVIKYPFGSVRISITLAKVMVLFCWIICFIIAILPIVQSKYFGDQFYSKSAVCLALPLTKNRSAGWLYSIVIFIGFNFITFIMIALGQIMIYYEVHKHSSAMAKNSSARRNDLKVAKNLLLLVTTDFACWFPIGCIGMLSLNGHIIPGEIYAWTAVLILPINSAINPFLYTLMAVINNKKFNPSTDEQARFQYATVKRKGLLQAYRGLWFPDQNVKYDVYNLKNDVVLTLKPRDLLWIHVEFWKILHLHHRRGLFFKYLKAEHVLVFLPTNKIHGGVRIEQKPIEFTTDTAPKKDIYMAGEILRSLTKS
ncbi:uncharacterized protein LOC123563440 [Mercenaria mercenaria]|uniref:uncharacterized protein LOC123563440 n=1 Tax=Mercenaria mercenaria TaxID=6596 RepID=UPI00234E4667|nr:uncharacterized protein LOC123563440 [Mercenaria mercenaria]